MKRITFLGMMVLLISKFGYCQLSDTLVTWHLANDTSPTYSDSRLKAKGERFGNKLTNVTYTNGFQKIAPPNGGWSTVIDSSTTAGVYVDFPFGLVATYNIAYGCTFIHPNDISLSAYTDATNDSIKITPYLYDSSLYVDSSVFCFWDTANVHPVTYSCGGGIGYDYYKHINGHWYYFHYNFSQFKFDSTLVLNYYQGLYKVKASIRKGTDFYISSNSASNPNSILNYLNYTNNDINNERLLFLRLYISSSNPNANLYLKQFNIGGGFLMLLPISFSNFTATKNSNNIQLNWSMKDETNIDKYVIEKGVSKDLFKPIKTIAVSNNKTDYSCVDENPVIGENLYRIKAVTKDGKASYSNTLSVLFGSKNDVLLISPNPVKDVLNVKIKGSKQEKVLMQIVDFEGKIVQQKQQQLQAGENIFSINSSSFSKGIYTLVVSGSNNQSTQFVKE